MDLASILWLEKFDPEGIQALLHGDNIRLHSPSNIFGVEQQMISNDRFRSARPHRAKYIVAVFGNFHSAFDQVSGIFLNLQGVDIEAIGDLS